MSMVQTLARRALEKIGGHTFKDRKKSEVLPPSSPNPKSEDVIFRKPTIVDLLKRNLAQIDSEIEQKRAEWHKYLLEKTAERNAVREEIFFLELTPKAEEYMTAIWERIKQG